MAAPLTHHEILELSAAFARSGRHVDLQATQRLERRLSFKPVEHAAPVPGLASLRETFTLESFGTGTCRVTRTLEPPDGSAATLEAMGPDPAELLAAIDGVPFALHWRSGPGFVVARSYLLPAGRNGGLPRVPLLRRGVVQVDSLRLTLTVSEVRGVAGDIALEPIGAADLDLPEDLLAVIGWDWARMIRNPLGWRSKLRLRGGSPRRTAAAERALDAAARHLADSLARPPAAFHDRYRAARRGVVLRRAIPLLTPVCLIATVLALPRFDFGHSSAWLLLYHVPTLLIALAFRLQELPQFEIPPWPRRSPAPSWRRESKARA